MMHNPYRSALRLFASFVVIALPFSPCKQNSSLAAESAVLCWWGWREFENPVPPGMGSIVECVAGADHFLGLSSDGGVHEWGWGSGGNVPADLGVAIAIAAGRGHSVALRADGIVRAWGDNGFGQTTIPIDAVSIIAIGAGDYHTLAVRSAGLAMAWGRNESGQSDVPPGLRSVVRVAGGAAHSLALRSNGTVVCWGSNDSGQASVPVSLPPISSIAAADRHSVVLLANGTVVCWGANEEGQCNVPPDLVNVVRVEAGKRRTAAIRSDIGGPGRYAIWGDYSSDLDLVRPAIGLGTVSDLALSDSSVAAVLSLDAAAAPSRPRSFKVFASGGNTFAYGYDVWLEGESGFSISTSGQGLPNGAAGAGTGEDDWGGVWFETRAGIQVTGHGVNFDAGYWENCQWCGPGNSFWCPDSSGGSIDFWFVVDRPHRIGASVSIVGLKDEWFEDDYGGWSQRYCNGDDPPKIRLEAYDHYGPGIAGKPRIGPWGSHSVDLSNGQEILISGPSQGPESLAGYIFRVTVPPVVDLESQTRLGSLAISRVSPADVIPDGIVNALDLGAVIADWGLDPFGRAASDINLDGRIDGFDLGEVLFRWGTPG